MMGYDMIMIWYVIIMIIKDEKIEGKEGYKVV